MRCEYEGREKRLGRDREMEDIVEDMVEVEKSSEQGRQLNLKFVWD